MDGKQRTGELKEAVALAVDVLRRNPLRSILTVLGIVIGVTTIIVIGAVIDGLNSNVLGNISQLGSSTIIVSKPCGVYRPGGSKVPALLSAPSQ